VRFEYLPRQGGIRGSRPPLSLTTKPRTGRLSDMAQCCAVRRSRTPGAVVIRPMTIAPNPQQVIGLRWGASDRRALDPEALIGRAPALVAFGSMTHSGPDVAGTDIEPEGGIDTANEARIGGCYLLNRSSRWLLRDGGTIQSPANG
jgi:hypothetical protein